MLLEVQNLSKAYPGPEGPVRVLDRVSLQLSAGQTLALMGESGSGKSTLLHLVAGLDRADDGEIVLNGHALGGMHERALAAYRRDCVAVVFQQFNLIPSLKVRDNLAFQARLAGRLDRTWQARLTERLGLVDLLERYPEQLSGGQQQRVAVGRALALRPPLLLADEPTGNLDEATAEGVLALMLELVAEIGAGLLMVTHSAQLAARLDRQLLLRAGRIFEPAR
ncbi:ABC transporter ATP-binding protein [Pseudomonas sp.]|jgi:putative ABC transport system ATP-binding protein|uniref:ABC transporter ATP-binding protein n=1 Tax=Pseudomonas sp. TaxID=306 RepID=UPI00272A16BD|nr:ABC transporter ATP-binding protein [Pseudomonas sp.]